MSISELIDKLGLRPIHADRWGATADSDKDYARAAVEALRAVERLDKFQPHKEASREAVEDQEP